MKIASRIIVAAAALSTPLSAQQTVQREYEDIAALDEQVAAFIGKSGPANAGGIIATDRRLKLARCPQLPVIDPPSLGAVAVRCLPLGWRIRVGLTPLSYRSADETDAAISVRRGDAVELMIGGDGFDISATAVALDDGAVGKSIRVKTPTGKNPFTAVVRGAGAVQIIN